MVTMRKSHLSQFQQDRLIEHFAVGTTVGCAASLVGVNFKASAYYFHWLRETIACQFSDFAIIERKASPDSIVYSDFRW